MFADYVNLPRAGPMDTVGLSDAATAMVSGIITPDGDVDITDQRNGFARLTVQIPPDAAGGRYPIEFDEQLLSIGSASARWT